MNECTIPRGDNHVGPNPFPTTDRGSLFLSIFMICCQSESFIWPILGKSYLSLQHRK